MLIYWTEKNIIQPVCFIMLARSAREKYTNIKFRSVCLGRATGMWSNEIEISIFKFRNSNAYNANILFLKIF